MRLSLLACFLAVPAIASEEGEGPGVAMTDLKASVGVEPQLASLVGEIMLTELKNEKAFGSVVGGSDLRAMLEFDQQKAALGCDETNCIAQLGGALGVPLMVTSTLGRLGGAFVLTVVVIDVEASLVKVRQVTDAADERQLRVLAPWAIRRAVAELWGRPEPAKPAVKAAASAPSVAKGSSFNAKKVAFWGGGAVTLGGAVLAGVSMIQAGELKVEYSEINAKYSGGNVPTSDDSERMKDIVGPDGESGYLGEANTRSTIGLAVSGLGLALVGLSFVL